MGYEISKEFVILLDNGEYAQPVKVESRKTGNISFRSAPQSINVLGTDWDNNEVEVSEEKMVEDVLFKGRRTRCISPSLSDPSLKGQNSRYVKAIYVLRKKGF